MFRNVESERQRFYTFLLSRLYPFRIKLIIIIIIIIIRIWLLNENTHDSLQLWVSCLHTHQADLMEKNPIILYIYIYNK